MTKGSPIFIRQVKNGFILEPSTMFDHAGYSNDDIVVFNKMEDLNAFLVKHFDKSSK